MNKYDELLSTLILAKNDIIDKISDLEQERENIQKDTEQKEKTLTENKQRIEELKKIREVLENFSFKVPKRFIFSRLFAFILACLPFALLFILLRLLSFLGLKEIALVFFVYCPLILILEQAFEAFKKRKILKNNNYEDIQKQLRDLINNNKELALALEKDIENMENINQRINIEIDKKAEIEAKIKQVYNQKYKALTSLINVTYDKELSKIYDQDEVIKRVLQKEDTYE